MYIGRKKKGKGKGKEEEFLKSTRCFSYISTIILGYFRLLLSLHAILSFYAKHYHCSRQTSKTSPMLTEILNRASWKREQRE